MPPKGRLLEQYFRPHQTIDVLDRGSGVEPPRDYTSRRGEYPPPTTRATDEEANAFRAIIPANGGILMPPQVFCSMLKSGLIVKMSRTVVADNNVKTMKKRAAGEDYAEEGMVYLNQDTGVAYLEDPSGALPSCYYAHADGYIIACGREWIRRVLAKPYQLIGKGDILAYEKRPKTMFFLVRTYTILSNINKKDPAGYRLTRLYDERANGHAMVVHMGTMVRSTFECPRPSIDHQIGHHHQNKQDDSLSNTEWQTRSVNCNAENSDPR